MSLTQFIELQSIHYNPLVRYVFHPKLSILQAFPALFIYVLTFEFSKIPPLELPYRLFRRIDQCKARTNIQGTQKYPRHAKILKARKNIQGTQKISRHAKIFKARKNIQDTQGTQKY